MPGWDFTTVPQYKFICSDLYEAGLRRVAALRHFGVRFNNTFQFSEIMSVDDPRVIVINTDILTQRVADRAFRELSWKNCLGSVRENLKQLIPIILDEIKTISE